MVLGIIITIIIYLLLLSLYGYVLYKQIKINEWKREKYKGDLKTVIIFGLTAGILGGILAGLIDATLTNVFGLGISFSLLLCSLFVGFSVRKGYENYHVLYPTLALVFFIVSLFFSQLSYYVGLVGIQQIGTVLSDPNFYINIITVPTKFLFIILDDKVKVEYVFYLILNILFFGLSFYAVFRIAKGNRS
jgi:hypothetical protein